MPPDDHKTAFSPGDLYDVLATSAETRFHAGYLFLRYFLFVGIPEEDSSSLRDEEIQAVIWDIAVACLVLSIKVSIRLDAHEDPTHTITSQFHRDVLFPLEIIYAEDFIDLAPHEMEFDDLEHAQRDVLDVLGYLIGSATPGAFMEELWNALPTLHLLLAFDGGWADVQNETWEILCDVLHGKSYPISHCRAHRACSQIKTYCATLSHSLPPPQ